MKGITDDKYKNRLFSGCCLWYITGSPWRVAGVRSVVWWNRHANTRRIRQRHSLRSKAGASVGFRDWHGTVWLFSRSNSNMVVDSFRTARFESRTLCLSSRCVVDTIGWSRRRRLELERLGSCGVYWGGILGLVIFVDLSVLSSWIWVLFHCWASGEPRGIWGGLHTEIGEIQIRSGLVTDVHWLA